MEASLSHVDPAGTASASRSRRASHRRALLLLAAAAIGGTGCHYQAPVAPSALTSSREFVQVHFATPRQLRLVASGRSMLLDGVTRLEGWPHEVRGDTLRLQVTRWAAHEHVRDLQPAEYVATIVPTDGATIERRQPDRTGTALVAVLAVVVLAGAAFVLYLIGNYED